jgi:hypothetical protein
MRSAGRCLVLLALVACGDHEAGLHLAPGGGGADLAGLVPVERPPFTPGVFPCSRCHEGGPRTEPAEPVMPHTAHLERELECADCHMPEDEDEPALPGAEICRDCHEDLAGEPEAVRAYFERATDAGGDLRFPDRWAVDDLKFRHRPHLEAEVGCETCHGAPSDAAFRKPKPLTLMRLCIACHEERNLARECATCHERHLEPEHRAIVLRHAEDQRGCLDCHDAADRDRLRLADGETLPFEESYRLCGQCHGPRLRDWRLGLHGKRLGRWDGGQSYLLCVHCHDPHEPRFPSMVPAPRPPRPQEVR